MHIDIHFIFVYLYMYDEATYPVLKIWLLSLYSIPIIYCRCDYTIITLILYSLLPPIHIHIYIYVMKILYICICPSSANAFKNNFNPKKKKYLVNYHCEKIARSIESRAMIYVDHLDLEFRTSAEAGMRLPCPTIHWFNWLSNIALKLQQQKLLS